MVREFHAAFDHQVRAAPKVDVPEAALRWDLLEEEFMELRNALENEDVIATADSLADLLYVIYGAALTFGIPIDDVLEEVHRSNMSKLGEDGRPVKRPDGKILKGPNYSPPDIEGVLRRV